MQTRKEIKKLRPPVTRKSQYGLEFRMNPRPGPVKPKLIKSETSKEEIISGNDKAEDDTSAAIISKLKKW